LHSLSVRGRGREVRTAGTSGAGAFASAGGGGDGAVASVPAGGGGAAGGGAAGTGAGAGEAVGGALELRMVHAPSNATTTNKTASRFLALIERAYHRRGIPRSNRTSKSHFVSRIVRESSVKFKMVMNVQPPRSTISSSPQVTPVGPTKVLVVDDEYDVREALAEVLIANGYEVMTAANGDEALGILDRDESIDLVLLDMSMPELDGFDILRRLKSHERRSDIPVICLSARAAVEDKVAGLKLGAADYVAKPFDVQELFARMARPLRVKRVLERLDRAKAAAEHLSLTDPLTGLPNRRDLERRLKEEIDRSDRTSEPLGCLIIDVDRFKLVNDEYGHAAGDAVLAEVSSALQASLRSFDVVGRFGGDEFVALLPGATLEDTRQVAEALCDVISTLVVAVTPKHAPLHLSISVGAVSHEPGTNEDAAALLDRADAALLEAKRSGRNRVEAGA
jgi:two-component system cell cycle response regulator